MIDIHSHIMYDVDDGSKNIDDSLNMLQSLSDNGVTDIILTPHFISETNYQSSKENNIKKLKKLQKEINNRNININLYLGNEIYIDKNILDFIYENKMSPLNNSKYLLIELPMSGIYNDYIDIFESLNNSGYKIILAHPERYLEFQNNFAKIVELNDLGILFQCNIDSILGVYGNKAKKTMKKILKKKLVSFVGTDIHKDKDNYDYLNKSIDKFKKYLSKSEIDDILINNPKKIIAQ